MNIWDNINWKELKGDCSDYDANGYWFGFHEIGVAQYDANFNLISILRFKSWKH